MKKALSLAGAALLAAILLIPIYGNGPGAAKAGDLLTGDQKDACEALLCLSTGKRPSECTPPLRRYFSITDKKAWKTRAKRRDFLGLCPEVKTDHKTGTLADAIVNGADRCDAKSLNRYQRRRITLDDQSYIDVIKDQLPIYCTNYYNHEYTDLSDDIPKYVGTPEKGGFWVEPSEYEEALAAYNLKLQQEEEREQRMQKPVEGGGA